MSLTDKLIQKLFAASNGLNNPTDNCLLCKHSDIWDNEVAHMFRRLGMPNVANKIQELFPLVNCKVYDTFIVNPLRRPGWCKRGRR